MRRFVALVVALLAIPVVSRAAPATTATASTHLRTIVRLSPAPEYRRFGAPGMAKVAAYESDVLARAGYRVVHEDFPLDRWMVDYRRDHAPDLVRLSDGAHFKSDSVFQLGGTTGPAGITCTVRAITDVKPGDCGFVPFDKSSPEWKNAATYDAKGAVAQIKAAGGVGAILQGDVNRGLVFALQIKGAVPAVVAVARPDQVIGRQVRLRVMGSRQPATGHDVIAVRRPPAGASQYVVLLAHADGWYQAAADNGGGTAAVLRAAEQLAGQSPGVGVVVALMDAEEVGLVGSKVFVDALASKGGIAVGDGGPPLRIADMKAVVNLDASSARASDAQSVPKKTARTDAPLFSWRVMVAAEEPALAAAFNQVFPAHQILGLPLTAGATVAIEGSLRSDIAWFQKAGVPWVWPAAGYPEYHTDGDTLAAVDPADLERLADAAVELTRRIASLPIGRIPSQFR
ncbi:MAG: peptidase [Acidimicrobiales bacterium]|jgi:hypothetical protein|nr:peptidase [Acidimicrobiales bacterium]